MIDHNSLPSERPKQQQPRHDAAVRLPVRLYESRGVIFELYDGDQPQRPTAIRWQRVESIEGMASEPPELHRRLEDER
jgi:hypothetical protein